MATSKGQNFRILVVSSSNASVIGMATNCTVTLNSNTDESSTKDDTGMASKPTVVSKSWQVQVESLSVADVGTLLSAIKNQSKFTLMWDETSTTDNQTPLEESMSRCGEAYLTDATFTFNDRENSVKSLQFSGVGSLSQPSFTGVPVSPGSYTKGQFVRLFLSGNNTTTPASVVAAAKQLSIHFSLSMEDATTKDTTGDWQIQEPTALNYDISTTALMRSGDTITSAVAGMGLSELESIYEDSAPVKWQIANVSGDNNRTKGSVICSGSCIIQTLTLQGPNRQKATYQASLAGFGDFSVGA